jgi:hypothetical protein
MKKLLLTVTLSLACVAAFAQGKVNFQNNSLHLVYWDPSSGGTNAGQAYNLGDRGYNLVIELWAGTSSTSLALQTTTDFGNQSSPGTWVGHTYQMPTVAPGANFFDIRIYSNDGLATHAVNGDSGLFTANSSGGTAYFSLVQHISPAFSTWADGAYNMDSLAPGYRGAIALIVPEPTTMALVGLGGAALMIFRRRK